jgi:hypothetical protein
MEINNKYNIGDTVFIVRNNNILETKVESMIIRVEKDGREIKNGTIVKKNGLSIEYLCKTSHVGNLRGYSDIDENEVYSTNAEAVSAITKKI